MIGPRYIGSADSAEDARATHVKVTDQPLTATIQIELAIRDAFDLARALHPLEAALDPDGLSTTARAVLQKIVSARTQ